MDYKRGDIFYIDGGKTYATGYDTPIGRPGIIVSNDAFNEYSDYVEVVYLTTQPKKSLPTHCEIVCRQKSTALCETIYTINKTKIGDYIKSCTSEEMQRLNESLLNSLGLDYISDFAEPIDDRDYDAMVIERDLYKNLYEKLLDKVVG